MNIYLKKKEIYYIINMVVPTNTDPALNSSEWYTDLGVLKG